MNIWLHPSSISASPLPAPSSQRGMRVLAMGLLWVLIATMGGGEALAAKKLKVAPPPPGSTLPIIEPTIPRDSSVAPDQAAPSPPSTTPQTAAPPTLALPSVSTSGAVVPMTRAEMARFFIDWFKLDTQPQSTFPVFVDVPLTHPDYPAIDRVRRLHLMLADQGGTFRPDAPATRLDAWMALAKLLFPKNTLTDREAAIILANYAGQEQLAPFEKKRVARLFMGRVLSPATDVPIEPNTLVNAGWMQATLAQLQANRQFLKDQEKQQASSQNPAIDLPAGIAMSITPSEAIAAGSVALGSQFEFVLTQPITLPDGTLIPTDSNLRGIVMGVEGTRYTIAFDSLASSQTGQLFKLKAQLVVQLQAPPVGETPTKPNAMPTPPASGANGTPTKPDGGGGPSTNGALIITGNVFKVITEPLPPPPAFEDVKQESERKAPPPPPSAVPVKPILIVPPPSDSTPKSVK